MIVAGRVVVRDYELVTGDAATLAASVRKFVV